MNDEELLETVRRADPVSAGVGQTPDALFERVLAAARAEAQATAVPVRRRMRPLLVAAAAAAALALAGVAIGGSSLFHFSPRLGEVPRIGDTRSEVIATLESRLSLVSNATVFSETVPAAPDNASEHARAVSGLAVKYDLSVTSTQGADIGQALWEGDLFTGALRDEFAARGLGDVIDAYGTFVTPDGTRESAGGGVSYAVATNQVFNAVPSDIVTTIARNAASVGLRSVQVDTLPVLQDALVIRATSDAPQTDVAALLAKGGLRFLLGENPADFEGVYLQIDDGSGAKVYDVDTAPRAGGGGFWAAPSLGIGGDYRAVPTHR